MTKFTSNWISCDTGLATADVRSLLMSISCASSEVTLWPSFSPVMLAVNLLLGNGEEFQKMMRNKFVTAGSMSNGAISLKHDIEKPVS